MKALQQAIKDAQKGKPLLSLCCVLLSLLPLQSEHTNATEDEGLQLTVELGTSRLVEVPVPCGIGMLTHT